MSAGGKTCAGPLALGAGSRQKSRVCSPAAGRGLISQAPPASLVPQERGMNLLCTLRWWGQANGREVFEVSAGQGLSPALCRQRLTASPLPSDTAAMCGLCRRSTSATWAEDDAQMQRPRLVRRLWATGNVLLHRPRYVSDEAEGGSVTQPGEG